MPELTKWSLTVGPGHPAGHGAIAMQLQTDAAGEHIEVAQPIVYPMHRGVEKLFESRTYQQLLSLADRHDWLSSFGSELGLAMLVEEQLGLSVPPRAVWIRTLMAELNRAIHHLRWLGDSAPELTYEAARDAGAQQMAAQASTAREVLISLHEAASGGRIHPMLVSYGGVRMDLPQEVTSTLARGLPDVLVAADALSNWWREQDHLREVGVLPHATAIEFATSGPVARASEHALDLRFDDSYLAYPELIEADVLHRITAASGDVYSRFSVLAEELTQSLAAVGFCAERLQQPDLLDEPVNVSLPRTVRVPEGTATSWTENPTGINEWFLVSTGGPTPERLKIRTASFANAQALCQILAGTRVVDLRSTLISFFLISGDVAK